MSNLSKEYLEEWERMVQDARQHMYSPCPLIEDGVILAIDERLKFLEDVHSRLTVRWDNLSEHVSSATSQNEV